MPPFTVPASAFCGSGCHIHSARSGCDGSPPVSTRFSSWRTRCRSSRRRYATRSTASREPREYLARRTATVRRWFQPTGNSNSSRLAGPLRRVLGARLSLPPAPTPRRTLTVLPVRRTAYFCSGCPHNRSTVVPAGSLAAGGIGCHTLVTMAARDTSSVTGLTQMGGEGAQWIGQAPFTDVRHFFQNVGDGTFFHSGQLALQACVAAGVNVTYKILFNSAVAMTGAQEPRGGLTVPELTVKLRAEGVREIIVCTANTAAYRRTKLAEGVRVWSRDRLDEAQRTLREISGVTVLIYDQQCAAEARRLRRARQAAGAHPAGDHQRVRLRRLRRLRRQEQLSLGATRRHRVRSQDTDRPDSMQHRLFVSGRRLSVLRDGGGESPSGKTCTDGPAGTSRAGRPHASVGVFDLQHHARRNWRHRDRDRQPGARNGGASCWPPRDRTRSDRSQPEGGPGHFAPEDRDRRSGAVQPHQSRQRRLPPCVRSPGGSGQQIRRVLGCRPHVCRGFDKPDSNGGHGLRPVNQPPRRDGAAAAAEEFLQAAGQSRLSARVGGAVCQHYSCELPAGRRGVPGGGTADSGGCHRGRDPHQWRCGGRQHRRLPLGTSVGGRAGTAFCGDIAGSGADLPGGAGRSPPAGDHLSRWRVPAAGRAPCHCTHRLPG